MTRPAGVVPALLSLLISAPAQSQSLGIGPRVATIELAGSIEDVFVDARGNLIARSFLFGGSVHDAAGRSLGAVPGAAWGIGVGEDGRILIARSEPIANYSLETFTLDPRGLRSEGAVKLRFQPRDLCSLGARRFALSAAIDPSAPGGQARALIHEVDAAGATVRSFRGSRKGAGTAARDRGRPRRLP